MPSDLPPSAVAAPPIEYAPAPPRSRRWILRGAMLFLALAALIAGVRYGPRAWTQVQVLYWQRQCMNFALPPDQVVYEEEPSAVAKLVAEDPQYAVSGLTRGLASNGLTTNALISVASLVPSCWDRFTKLPVMSGLLPGLSVPAPFGTPGTTAVIFLHALTTPGGQRRLVIVTYSPEPGTFSPSFIEGYNCMPQVIIPATLTALPTSVPQLFAIDVMSGWPSKPPNVRIFAGQPDPNDLSHFTIRYQIWGQEDVIDGRIDDQENVTLTQRKIPDFPRQR